MPATTTTAAAAAGPGAPSGRMLIANGRLIDPSQGLDGAHDLLIEDGVVAAVLDREGSPDAGERHDGGKRVAHGLQEPAPRWLWLWRIRCWSVNHCPHASHTSTPRRALQASARDPA
jgi:hypothetical protein